MNGLRLPTYLVSLSCLGIRATIPSLWDGGGRPFSRHDVMELLFYLGPDKFVEGKGDSSETRCLMSGHCF